MTTKVPCFGHLQQTSPVTASFSASYWIQGQALRHFWLYFLPWLLADAGWECGSLAGGTLGGTAGAALGGTAGGALGGTAGALGG